MVSGVRYTAERSGVVIRRQPAVDGAPLSLLEQGDEIVASDVFIEEGIEWVKLAKGSARINGPRGKGPLNLSEDGFVPTEDPAQGMLLRKHMQVVVEETKEEGVLTKAEIKEILDKSSDPNMLLPLEAKYWARQQLEMFVMSGGTIRPKWCSVPDERLMANTNMSKEEIMRALTQAADWIANADALLIGSGAGMGVDSGLGTFRGGKKGVWQGLEAVGLAYEEICDPKWFSKEPHLAWAFWDHCYKAYQETTPHDGYNHIREWGQRCPLGFYSFTSNIDSHWITSGTGADRVLEVHGAVRWLQCARPCCPDVWKAPKDHGLTMLPTHRVSGVLPTCPKCKGVARPNVQMFGGDSGFSKARRVAQFTKYDAWLKQLEARPDKDSIRITCLEVGCGLTVPTVRKELETVMSKFPQARLIRVNPENPGISQELVGRGVSLPLQAGLAIEELRKQIVNDEAEVTFVLWGKQGGCEIRAPYSTCPGRLLRLAGLEEGISVDFAKDSKCLFTEVTGRTEFLDLDMCVPAGWFKEVKLPESSESQMTVTLHFDAAFTNAKHFSNLNLALQKRAQEVIDMLDDMNKLFEDPAYQAEVRKCVDRRGVIRVARAVHFMVLPKYNVECSEKGVVTMTHLIGTVQTIPAIQEKVDKSMDLSYVKHMNSLPKIAEPGREGAADSPTRAASLPMQISLTAVSASGDEGDAAQVEAESTTTVGELRRLLSGRWSWDDATTAAAVFLVRGTGAMRELRDADVVHKAMFVRSAPLHKPAKPVEVTLSEMPEEDGEEPKSVRVTLMSNCTIADLRAALGEAMAWSSQVQKRARFLIRLAGGFGTLKDSERVEGRKAIFVHSAPISPGVAEGLAEAFARRAAAAQDAPAAAGTAASARGDASPPAATAATTAAPAEAAGRPARAAGEGRQPRAAGEGRAAEDQSGWQRCPHYDIDLPPAENMDAGNLDAVRRRCELMGYSGFTVWAGRAYLKKANKQLRQGDLTFKGAGTPVEFHIYSGERKAPAVQNGQARGLTVEQALSLQKDLMEGFGSDEFQRKFKELRATCNPRRFASERIKLFLTVQGAVLPRYGFEGSLGGVMQMMEAFASPQLMASKEVQMYGVALEQLLQ